MNKFSDKILYCTVHTILDICDKLTDVNFYIKLDDGYSILE